MARVAISVTRKQNKIMPNIWKKWPKMSISKPYLKAQNIHIKLLLKPLDESCVEAACLVKIGSVKSSLSGEILPNLVTLMAIPVLALAP